MTQPIAKPACFPTVKLYREWRVMARRATEEASPCTDCSQQYSYEMREAGRCDRQLVCTAFRFTPNDKLKEKTP